MKKLVNNLIENYPDIKSCKSQIEEVIDIIIKTFKSGGKLLVCGNGGSAADSSHIVGELMKGFMKKRPLSAETKNKLKKAFPENGQYLADNLQGGLPAIALTEQAALITAFSNDVDPDMIFAQQVYGYGNKEDTILGISTSGNSTNIVNALKVGAAMGLHTAGLTGKDGGKMKNICDCNIIVPLNSTPEIQERHLPIYHTICQVVEAEFFQE
ncbi:MAG: D-sedoheptulose-7-phosphate isomerase [Halanaerobiaceae bacterium]